VAFSGGRDSSLVLAIAAHVARRDGLPDPIPITRRFPDRPEADEREWQERVVSHLRLSEWHRIDIEDELDVIGPLASEHLKAFGVVWPPAIAGDRPLVDAVRGGSLIDGEGGDQVLGVESHRVGPVTALCRAPRPLRRARLTNAAWAVAPAGPRARETVNRAFRIFPRPWLRRPALQDLAASLETVERDRPIAYSRSVRAIARRRGEVLGTRNRQLLASANGVSLSSPLLDPHFVEALAHDGGFLGVGSRTAVLRELASDLLPDEVLSRQSKATFNTCYMTTHTRDFASAWTGTGLDDQLVDCGELQRAWLADRPIPATAALLQTAWLAGLEHRVL
jgi:asparagine synthase (glutamine-hydrolysing)